MTSNWHTDVQNDSRYTEETLENSKDTATVNYVLMLVAVFFAPLLLGALVLAYMKRAPVKGHWLYTHFVWQIRTIWISFFVSILIVIMFGLTLLLGASQSDLGMVTGVTVVAIVVAQGIWYLYRAIFGLYKLHNFKPPRSTV